MVSTHTGTIRKTWVGDNVVLTRVIVHANSRGKPHAHAAEQVSMILRGGVKVTLGGAERIAKAGDIVHIPAKAVHMFEILSEETEILDVYGIRSSAEALRKTYPE
jgi:quercetin dioxygenase-like cupin family protein